MKFTLHEWNIIHDLVKKEQKTVEARMKVWRRAHPDASVLDESSEYSRLSAWRFEVMTVLHKMEGQEV